MIALISAGISLLAATTFASPVPVQITNKRQTSIPFGTVIWGCNVPGTVAVTFDDGPYIYTSDLLNLLAEYQFPVTFFVNGANIGNIYDYAPVVQRMAAEGHQVASHTWNHADLTTLDEAGITWQMTELEAALTTILGYFPTYMRPPYAAYNDQVLAVLRNLGYHVIQFDVDTLDWQNSTPDTIYNSATTFVNGIRNGARLSLSHDIHPDSVYTLAEMMINEVRTQGLTPVTVGSCIGDDPSNWYRARR